MKVAPLKLKKKNHEGYCNWIIRNAQNGEREIR